jgi:hypothetical protein
MFWLYLIIGILIIVSIIMIIRRIYRIPSEIIDILIDIQQYINQQKKGMTFEKDNIKKRLVEIGRYDFKNNPFYQVSINCIDTSLNEIANAPGFFEKGDSYNFGIDVFIKRFFIIYRWGKFITVHKDIIVAISNI